jgi:hypothetical protein
MLFRIILRGRILPGPNLRGRPWLAAFSFAPISTTTAQRNRRLVLSDCGGGKRRLLCGHGRFTWGLTGSGAAPAAAHVLNSNKP